MLTEKQIAERKSGIGGSDAGALLGLNKYKSRYQLFLEKTTELPPVKLENQFVYWGNILEPIVANEYAKQTGKNLTIIEDLQRHLDYPWMIGYIDRYIPEENAILECKTASSKMRSQWGESGTDNVPTEYLIQCAHYAIVLDAKYVDLAVLIDTSDFRIYRYDRNDALENILIEHERIFWNDHVLKNNPPDPLNNVEISLMWNASSNSFMNADSFIKLKIEELKKIKYEERLLQRQKENLEFLIKRYLKDNQILVDEFGNKLASWKEYAVNKFDTDNFKSVYPELYNQFIKQNTQRRFVING